MYNRFQVSNYFTTTLNNQLTLTQWLTGTTTIPLTAIPTIDDGKAFHVIITPTDTINRMVLKCFMDSGAVKCNNYDIPTTKTYDSELQVALFDVAELFNELYRNSNDFGKVEALKIWGLNVRISGGKASNPTDVDDDIADTTMLMTANGTYYIYYDYQTKAFVSSVTEVKNKFVCAKVVVGASSITSIVDYRSININTMGMPVQLTQIQINALTDIVNGFQVFNINTLFTQQYLNGTWYNIPISSTGGGDVFGPASSTDGNIMLANWVSGKQIKDSGIKIATTLNNVDTEIPTSKAIVDYNNTINTSAVGQLVDNSYMAGEAITAGQCVFVESWPIFAVAATVQNIWDVSGNTRVGFPVIGTGVAGTTLKLALKKFVSPWVYLWVRIETDNAGSPSGTIVTNGTATVLTSWLTTSLVDTTVTLAGSVTLTAGAKYHIVAFAGTYGSETVNGTNYFGIGYSTNDTTTRGLAKRNTTRWAATSTIFPYISSTLFQDKLLSLTDADFAYKVDLYGISTVTNAIGTYPKLTIQGINSNQGGLTVWTRYLLSWTPWSLSSSVWTYPAHVWEAISNTKIMLKKWTANWLWASIFAATCWAAWASATSTAFLCPSDSRVTILAVSTLSWSSLYWVFGMQYSDDNSTRYSVWITTASLTIWSTSVDYNLIKWRYYRTNVASSSYAGSWAITTSLYAIKSL